MNLTAEILAAINFGDLTSIIAAAGLALIGFAFLGFVLSRAKAAASGQIGEPDSDNDDDKDD